MYSRNNVQTLRCLQCMKEIQCSPVDPGPMVLHIQQDHPEIFAVAKEKIKNLHTLIGAKPRICDDRLSKNSKDSPISETQMATAAVVYLANKKKNGHGTRDNRSPTADDHVVVSNREETSCQPTPCTCPADKEVNRKQSFKASITHWAPAEGNIFCPSCGFSQRPQIRTAMEMRSTGSAANCIFACWPLCCLPCLESREYLYCSNCRAFLGIYDREKNCVRPSREFVVASTEKEKNSTIIKD